MYTITNRMSQPFMIDGLNIGPREEIHNVPSRIAESAQAKALEGRRYIVIQESRPLVDTPAEGFEEKKE